MKQKAHSLEKRKNIINAKTIDILILCIFKNTEITIYALQSQAEDNKIKTKSSCPFLCFVRQRKPQCIVCFGAPYIT